MPVTPSKGLISRKHSGDPSRSAVLLGLGSDGLIALLKFAAARQSGSTSLFTEGVHSLLDVLTELILLYGLATALRPSDIRYQLGYGRSAFFWNLVAAVLILALSAGVALPEAWRQFNTPAPIHDPAADYGVLGLSFLIDAVFAVLTYRRIKRACGHRTVLQYLRRTRDGAVMTIIYTDMAALAGLVLAALGTLLSTTFNLPAADGVASMAIALMMAATALLLVNESRSLIIGAPASAETIARIQKLAAEEAEVAKVNGAISVRIGPRRLVVTLSISFKASCRTADIEGAVASMEKRIKAAVPEVTVFFVKPQSPAGYAALQSDRGW